MSDNTRFPPKTMMSPTALVTSAPEKHHHPCSLRCWHEHPTSLHHEMHSVQLRGSLGLDAVCVFSLNGATMLKALPHRKDHNLLSNARSTQIRCAPIDCNR
eukprot:1563083-Amphidinium_carterae.1